MLQTLQQTLSILASVAVATGVVIALLQLRNQHRLRQMEIVMRLYGSFGEEGFTRHFERVMSWSYKSYAAFRRKKSREDYISLIVVSVFFENMGLLLKRGLAPIDLLDDLLSGPILAVWPKVKPIWVGMRAEHHHPAWAEWFEYFYESMARRMKDLEGN